MGGEGAGRGPEYMGGGAGSASRDCRKRPEEGARKVAPEEEDRLWGRRGGGYA